MRAFRKTASCIPCSRPGLTNRRRNAVTARTARSCTAKALLDRNPNPTDAEIRTAMDGALCRCMTYYRVQTGDQARGARYEDSTGVSHMSTSLQFPKLIEDALLSVNSTTSRRNFLKSSGALVFSLGISSVPGAKAFAAGSRRRPVSRSRLPATRHLDRDSSRQHGNLLCRQD